ncbi:Hypothetical predicted protein [Olea europaea subsp. europaea]|uniref:Uncharacterized protein n=1 Tax=Olea europaea subsp. europaea TaxID=158383 RepID=A0A8S0RQB0_OLEEU|nr:Hypothetical predicted protein [Olea europaea subsp. europaea]
MDSKSLAKSKRAHSLHHSKKHNPHQTSKVPSVSSGTASGGKKQPGKQVADKPQQSQSLRKLPSNWDRYEEEFVLDSEDTIQENSSQATDVVRKSKGADYAYLIQEAKAESQGNFSSDIFSSLSDVLDDFTQGLGPLLSSRGQGIMSWIANDNFKLEDKATTGYEAPFLSLNLHALAEQFAKAKVSERLFAEPDLLPPELLDELQGYSKDKHEVRQISHVTLAAETANDVSSLGQEPEENIFRERDHISSAATITADLPIPAAIDVNHVDQRSLPESISNVNVDLAAKKSARFEAIDAEAELDMLLDSCSETEFFGSLNMTKRSNTLSYVQQEDTCQLGSAESLNEGHDVKKHAKMPAFDNTIDDLLEETSALININDKTLPHDVKAAPSSSDSVSKSKLLDDFDSWLDTI